MEWLANIPVFAKHWHVLVDTMKLSNRHTAVTMSSCWLHHSIHVYCHTCNLLLNINIFTLKNTHDIFFWAHLMSRYMGHGGLAGKLPGFATSWQQNQVTRQPYLHGLTQVVSFMSFCKCFLHGIVVILYFPKVTNYNVMGWDHIYLTI